MSTAAEVLIAMPDGSWLALTRDALDAARQRGAELMGQPAAFPPATAPSALLSAAEMEAATGKPASWFERQARERRIPAHKLGRQWRFRMEEVAASTAKPRIDSALNAAGHGDR